MIVLKFGGTSVGTAAKIADSAAIVERQPLPRAVVVSAVGGVTNLLLEAAAAAAAGDDELSRSTVAKIHDKHAAVVADTGIRRSLVPAGDVDSGRRSAVVEN